MAKRERAMLETRKKYESRTNGRAECAAGIMKGMIHTRVSMLKQVTRGIIRRCAYIAVDKKTPIRKNA